MDGPGVLPVPVLMMVCLDFRTRYPPEHVKVDALVAPSHFVKEHPSVIVDPTPCFVINPAIHIDSFVPHSSRQLLSNNLRSSLCVSENDDGAAVCGAPHVALNRPFRVGFVARLAPEKNPGLFLRMAAEISARLAARDALWSGGKGLGQGHGQRTIEFIVVGDGEIRNDLEDFTRFLFTHKHLQSELDHENPLVKFTGWVRRDSLPEMLSTIDVLVNPSLRDSETFCIANLEVRA